MVKMMANEGKGKKSNKSKKGPVIDDD